MHPVDLPHLTGDLPHPEWGRLAVEGDAGHPPRILLLYGSLRPQSFSRKLALEAERILRHLGDQLCFVHGSPSFRSAPIAGGFALEAVLATLRFTNKWVMTGAKALENQQKWSDSMYRAGPPK